MLNQKVTSNTESTVKSINEPSDVAYVVYNAIKLAKIGSQIQLAQQPDSRFESSSHFNPTYISALKL